MKTLNLRILASLVLLSSSLSLSAETVRLWAFDHNGDREGWTTRLTSRGAVLGGSIWLTLSPLETDAQTISSWKYQLKGDSFAWYDNGLSADHSRSALLISPGQLRIQSSSVTEVRMRVLNLSSLTDFYIQWESEENGWGELRGGVDPPLQAKRCTLEADKKEWQEITCQIGERWQGTVNRLAVTSPQRVLRGDLWIDRIEIGKGEPKPSRPRPDVSSDQVLPLIDVPGLSNEGFHNAFKALDKCLVSDVPMHGFRYPFMSPGGYYTNGGWWQLDTSLALIGSKWVNQPFAENVIRGFAELQDSNPDGRINLFGLDGLRGQVGDQSSLPAFFEVAYDISRRTSDLALRLQIYDSMRKYLDWWLSPVKRDSKTGLISGTFEETFGDTAREGRPLTLAPVDLNVAVAVGAARTAELASKLGKGVESAFYQKIFNDLASAINAHLWNESNSAYHNLDLRTGKLREGLNVATFDTFRLGIAPKHRRNKLKNKLTNPALFNWGQWPLTSLAMTDPGYIEAPGANDGRAWFGNVWTLRNMVVIQGLEEINEPNLAAELNWATIKAFHNNYYEYLVPSTGEGQGESDYAWTASQYAGAVIEHLFGIDFDRIRDKLTIRPHIPAALYGKSLKIDRLLLPGNENARLTLTLKMISSTHMNLSLQIDGNPPASTVLVIVPGTNYSKQLPLTQSVKLSFPEGSS